MFDNTQREFLSSLNLKMDFDNLTENDLILIEDTVSAKLQSQGFDINYKPNEIGKICETILDEL